ncbi:uncharacterized protein [Primulina eburnea]|uniref:uncharacterized protein n=1 Tax=Primulina eburnea TaxID=1245227 RepID=UPI003C6BEFB6
MIGRARYPTKHLCSSSYSRGLSRDNRERGHFRDRRKEKVICHERRLIRSRRNIFIKRIATKAFLDSEATHSFISKTFANYLGVKSIGLDMSYSVTVPSGEGLSATSMVRNIDLELQGHLVYVDLIVLPMPDFDIILGMGLLMKNIVLIDFQKRTVLVRPLGMEQFLFEPNRWKSFPRMISCMQAQKLMHKGCQGFLASIISAPDAPTPSIPVVLVFRDFLDVFTDDIIGLPPQREVEFAIDLVL